MPVRHTDLIPAIYGQEDNPDWMPPPIDEVALWQRIEDLGARYTTGRADLHRVMVLRYREHEPRRTIAELFGVHQSRIAQIEAKMLRLLRHPASRAKFERPIVSSRSRSRPMTNDPSQRPQDAARRYVFEFDSARDEWSVRSSGDNDEVLCSRKFDGGFAALAGWVLEREAYATQGHLGDWRDVPDGEGGTVLAYHPAEVIREALACRHERWTWEPVDGETGTGSDSPATAYEAACRDCDAAQTEPFSAERAEERAARSPRDSDLRVADLARYAVAEYKRSNSLTKADDVFTFLAVARSFGAAMDALDAALGPAPEPAHPEPTAHDEA